MIPKIYFLKVLTYKEIEWRECKQTIFDPDYVDARDIKVKKMNRTTRGVFGNLISFVPLDDSYAIDINVFIKQGGQYKKIPFKPPTKTLCKFLMEDEYFYEELAAVSNYPFPFKCPLPIVT